MKYICVAPDKERFNIYGESLGMEGERALYFDKKLHRQRVYRSSYPIPHKNTFRLFIYKKKETAQQLCDDINKSCVDDFVVKELGE